MAKEDVGTKKSIKSPYLKNIINVMAESKTMSLTIGERLAAIKIFDAFKGSISVLANLMEDIKNFTITQEEWDKANLVKTPTGAESEQWKWDENETTLKEITMQDSTIKYLADEISRKSDSGEITIADIPLISLQTKLK